MALTVPNEVDSVAVPSAFPSINKRTVVEPFALHTLIKCQASSPMLVVDVIMAVPPRSTVLYTAIF